MRVCRHDSSHRLVGIVGLCVCLCAGGETGAVGIAVCGCLSQQVEPVAAVCVALYSVRARDTS